MSRIPNEDLFEDTKMTFGQHLDELRTCLVKAMIGLLIGVIIGLCVAHHVVRWIQHPLVSALEKFQLEQNIAKFDEEYGDKLPADVKDFMARYNLVADEVLIEASEIARAQQADQVVDATDADAVALAVIPPPTTKMIKTRFWRRVEQNSSALSATEPFMIWLKAGFISGLVIASPLIFYQIWGFVAAGLYPHEKRYVHIFLPISLILFWSGVCVAFFFVFEPVLTFLFSFNKTLNIDPDPRISEWISFVLMLPLGFGIAFQLPLVMLFLNRIGIVELNVYISQWRVAVLVISVVSMLLTPADPVSMLLMAVPLSFLYFVGIMMCKFMPRNQNPFDEGYDPTSQG